jgi:asparagine synthase (glutamine-hydrolysing)
VCGICGFVGPPDEAANRGVIEAMNETIRHRGPDAGGTLEIGSDLGGLPAHGWLGNRRLRILDVRPVADQPMVSEDGSVALTWNGEIYNFQELRTQLESAGHRFRTTGDTEVILRAYLEWGNECVERLDGMFALALWDARRGGQLLLARDRVGKKPLFYACAGGRLTFGSEIKALLAAPWLAAEPELDRLPEYLTFGYVPYPGTFYRGIAQVPPASTVVFDRQALGPAHRYWDPLPSAGDASPSGRRAGLASLLRDATKRRMVADVPLGAFLSGGIDSSIVVGLMSRLSDEPVLTFSAGFPDDPTYDERPHARRVAEHFGTRHTEFAVKVDAVSLIDRLLWHHDQPYADSSAIPTYLVSQLAREHVTVALTGDGGDEVFGGYERFRAALLARRLPHPLARLARGSARLAPTRGGYYSVRRRLDRFFELAERPVEERYLGWISVFSRDALGELLARPAGPEVFASVQEAYDRAGSLPALDRILYANFLTYLPDDLAVKADRTSMANSLELRSPFLDTSLVEHLATVPARQKVGLRRLKPLLREAFAELLPADVWRRQKHGFGVPMGHWFRHGLAELFEDEVLAAGSRTEPLLERNALDRLWREHRAGAADHGARLWTLLNLEHWLRSLERPGQTAPSAAVARTAAAG